MSTSQPVTRVVRVGTRPASIEFSKGALRVVSGPDQGSEIEVETSTVRIGTSSACQLVLTDTAASRVHCEIEVGERGFCLRDLDSTNGTFVGGVRLGEAYLAPLTRFEVGESTIEFQALDEQVEILLSESDHFGPVIGESIRMREIFYLLEKFAPKDVTILLTGETGTGKEILARAIHDTSPRHGAPFVPVDCGALTESLIESELFGHAKGAFTGATADRIGAFEAAHRGTVFLDEVGELPLNQQAKLLRVLEEREVRRVGETKPRHVDVRVIAATNRVLADEVEAETFRKDLFYRLSVLQIEVPPLRARREDIPRLAETFLAQMAAAADRTAPPRLALDALSVLSGHAWPGNVRELRNVLERAFTMADEDADIDAAAVLAGAAGQASAAAAAPRGDLSYSAAREIFEKAYILDVLRRSGLNVSRAAEAAGIQRQSLHRLMKKHGIRLEDLK